MFLFKTGIADSLLRFFENWIISKPIEFRDISLKDKEERIHVISLIILNMMKWMKYVVIVLKSGDAL